MKSLVWFAEVGKDDIPLVGGKGANLGEMTRAGLPVPPGFIVTADAYYAFMKETKIDKKVKKLLSKVDPEDSKRLNSLSKELEQAILHSPMPKALSQSIKTSYEKMCEKEQVFVAVRSSATAEDLPDASFAGQQETFLNIRGDENVVKAVRKAWASLFEPRAIYYRTINKFDHMKVGIAVPVQLMVNSVKSGVMFAADPVTSDTSKIVIDAGWGLGEAIVLGSVDPDHYVLSKEPLQILSKEISKQTWKIVRAPQGGDKNVSVAKEEQEKQKLSDEEILTLGGLAKKNEAHYGKCNDMEWAIDKDGKVFLVQSRPITTLKKDAPADAPAATTPTGTEPAVTPTASEQAATASSEPILHGAAASLGLASGPVKIIKGPEEIDKVLQGDILVTEMTNPEYVPAMRRAAAIVTNTGGRTSHAAIVSRELGIPCVVGTEKATETLKQGQIITVDGSKGMVYDGKLESAPTGVAAPAPAGTPPASAPAAPTADPNASTAANAEIILHGAAASLGLASGPVKIIHKPTEIDKVLQGDVLVTEMTNPEFVPAMRRASAIVTDTGGRTSHAAIVSRELGIPCVVGSGTATSVLKPGQMITVDGRKGLVYKGKVTDTAPVAPAAGGTPAPAPVGGPAWASGTAEMPPIITGTKVYVNLGEPHLAEKVAAMPVDGVGLLRAEFIIAGMGEHPRAMMKQGRSQEFVDKLAEGMQTICQAFNPRPVVYRATDFKTNEYHDLKGGAEFEPQEANPMIGFRGAFRYVTEPDLFKLELEAIKKVRNQYDLKNLWLMIPFVRSIEEFFKVKALVNESGLIQNHDFKLWIMCEVPSTVILMDKFCQSGIDGVSIGSNDLTQLTLGCDRDNPALASAFDERDEAVELSIRHVITTCKKHHVTVSICGQAPSVYPEITEMMVKAGATSVSVTPDMILASRKTIASVERRILLNDLAS